MNCSGKHAAMLTACVANGWPVDTYLDPSHPLQLMVRQVMADGAGEGRRPSRWTAAARRCSASR